MLFMGFSDEDFRALKDNNVEFRKGDWIFARDKIIRMAGNSIPVKLLEGIFWQILQIDTLLKQYCSVKTDEGNSMPTEDSAAIIRSYAFKNGIRSRVSKHDICPENASIVYPKYKTAIYLRECQKAIRFPVDAECALCNYCYWKKRLIKCWAEMEQHMVAIDMGWNAVVVNPCELHETLREDTLAWIVRCIREGGLDEQAGKVYSRGRY